MVIGAKRTRNEKFKGHQYMEGYDWCLESEIVYWGEGGNVEQMWEQVQQAIVDGAREVRGSLMVVERAQKIYDGMMG